MNLIGCDGYNCDVETVAAAMVSEAYNQVRFSIPDIKRISFIIEPKKTTIFDIFCYYLKPKECYAEIQSFSDVLIPGWEVMNGKYPLRVDVSASSEEYRTILRDFQSTMLTSKVKSNIRIERIQNERLYRQYQIEKRHFYDELKRNTEMTLYHGCHNNNAKLQSIMEQGLDRSRAGEINGKTRHLTYMCIKVFRTILVY
jgi:hypothetical protein